MLFFPERIFLSATDAFKFYWEHHRKGIYWTLKQGHSASARPILECTTVRRERTGNQNFPAKYAPSPRQVHCCSIYKMADEIQSPAKKRRKTEKTGTGLDDTLESKQQSAKKSGEIEKLNSLYAIFWPSSQQFSYKSFILKLFLQVKMWIVATILKKRWEKHSKLNFPRIFSIFGIFAKI